MFDSNQNQIAKWTFWEKMFLAIVVVGSLVLYGTIAYLPYAAIIQHRFVIDKGSPEKSKLEVERIKSIFGQLGTIGDMFGAVNALFTGFALAGLVYTAILQRKEIKSQQLELQRMTKEREDEEMLKRRMAVLSTANFLAQMYARTYSADIKKHDNDYIYCLEVERYKHTYDEKTAEHYDPKKSVKGKLLAYTKILEDAFATAELERNQYTDMWLARMNAMSDKPDPEWRIRSRKTPESENPPATSG